MNGRRLFLVLLALTLWVVGIGARLYHLQVERYEELSSRAERQQQRTVRLDPPRGTIYDARGRELAVSVEVDSLYAVPRQVEDPEGAAASLAPILDEPADELRALLTMEREFVWIARKLDRDLSRAIRELELEGLYFLRESKRYYPMGTLAAHVLGYVGIDNVGLGGLESEYDGIISGRPVLRTILRDARHGSVLHPDGSFVEAEPGLDLHLTLDATLQFIVERELAKAVTRFAARAGSVVMLDPRDGSILAMATHPTFDPNRFGEFSPQVWRNRPVTDAYEPGSTFKMVTAAAALEEGVVDPDDLFDCERGGVTVASVRIDDHKPFGLLTFREVLAKSSNVGIIKTGLRLDSGRYFQRIRDFGFGSVTGVDLPGENAGILRSFDRRPRVDQAFASFGQGLAVSPLQMTIAFASVANGGLRLRPYIVRQVGKKTRPPSRPVARSVSTVTARTLVDLLEGVVEEGTGRGARLEGYRVAGKTGTAQKSGPRGYSGYVPSFVGFAPVSDPRIVCLVMLDEPRRSIHGGEVAAPVFARIVEQSLLYLGVAPSRSRWNDETHWMVRHDGDGPQRSPERMAARPRLPGAS